jgi:hypothetical protein
MLVKAVEVIRTNSTGCPNFRMTFKLKKEAAWK